MTTSLKAGLTLVFCLLLVSCGRFVDLAGHDQLLLVLPQDVPSLAGLPTIAVRGKAYLLLKSPPEGEQNWLYGATLRGANGEVVRYHCGFSVLSSHGRAEQMMTGSGLLEKMTAPENKVSGLVEAYSADKAWGMRDYNYLSLMLVKGRVYYHVEIKGSSVSEAEVRQVILSRLKEVEARFVTK